MQYMIIGRVVDEKFDNMDEEIVGYYVVDDNGNSNFGAVHKIYQLYKVGKIKGSEYSGYGHDFSFFNSLESITFKTIHDMKLFCEFVEGMRVYNSKLKIYVSATDYRQLPKRTSNVYCKDYTYKLEEPICNENGYLLGYSIKCPDGKTIRLSCDDICNLASEPNIVFEDELFSSCCYYDADNRRFHYKIDRDLVAQYASNINGDTGLDLLKGYAKNISNLDVRELRFLVTNLFRYLIVPNNPEMISAFYGLFEDKFYDNLDYLINSSIETFILPSELKDRTRCIPLSNLKYSNAVLNIAQCIAISKDKGHDIFVQDYVKANSGSEDSLNMLSKFTGVDYVKTLYKEYNGMVITNSGTSLEIISSDIVKNGVFEVPKGVTDVWLCGLANRGIEHLILPETVKELWVDIHFDNSLSDFSNWLPEYLEDNFYSFGDIFDFGLLASLKSITFKGSLLSIFAGVADIIMVIEHIRHWNKDIKLYLQPDDYVKYKDISPIVHSVAEVL